jgi:hypothetical protein
MAQVLHFDDVISHTQGIVPQNKKPVSKVTTGVKTSFTSVTRLSR